MSLEIYSNMLVHIDGGLLCEETHVRINRTSGSNPQKTVAKGYAGESPGAPEMTIQIDSAIPAKDFEVNPGKYIYSLKQCEITILGASRTLTSKGFIISDDTEHGISAEGKVSFTFRGEPADWK